MVVLADTGGGVCENGVQCADFADWVFSCAGVEGVGDGECGDEGVRDVSGDVRAWVARWKGRRRR